MYCIILYYMNKCRSRYQLMNSLIQSREACAIVFSLIPSFVQHCYGLHHLNNNKIEKCRLPPHSFSIRRTYVRYFQI